MIKDVDHYIDSTIEDPNLREIDWNIAIYTLLHEWSKVLAAKWRRISYVQGAR